MQNKLCKIAVFYDGNYFFKASNYYLYQHPRRARLSFTGLHEFILNEISLAEGVDRRCCQIIDASYFRGRLPAQQAQEQDKLYSDRVFEDVLMRSNINLFQRHLRPRRDGSYDENGLDVWLALQTYEMASQKQYDVCVLVMGDNNFAPLIPKLNALGTRVMVLGWEFEYEYEGRARTMYTGDDLLHAANYPLLLSDHIDAPTRRNDPLVNGLFVDQRPAATPSVIASNPALLRQSADNSAERPALEPVDDVIYHGNIVSAINDKRYAFIRPLAGGENLFFHFNESNIPDDRISVGLPVCYQLAEGDRGPVAIRVEED